MQQTQFNKNMLLTIPILHFTHNLKYKFNGKLVHVHKIYQYSSQLYW